MQTMMFELEYKLFFVLTGEPYGKDKCVEESHKFAHAGSCKPFVTDEPSNQSRHVNTKNLISWFYLETEDTNQNVRYVQIDV